MPKVTVNELKPDDALVCGLIVKSVNPNVLSTTSGVRIEGKDILLVNKDNMVEIVFDRDGIEVSYHWSKVMEVELL